jgi:diguanylate cyclase (GGDEF)-like protein
LSVFLLLLVNIVSGLVVFLAYQDTLGHARRINAAGGVRGGMQRATKLALGGQKARLPGAIRLVERRLQAIPGVFRMNQPYRDEFEAVRAELLTLWDHLKQDLVAERRTVDWTRRVIARSEACWRVSDRMVLLTQLDAEVGRRSMASVFILIGVNICAIALFFYTIRRYVRLNLEYRAQHDALTGLYNRHTWRDLLQEEIGKALRYKYPLAAVMLDIDFFKRINDGFGHPAGDRVLQEVARLIDGQVRGGDSLFRIGGEEFFALLLHSTREQAVAVAERWRNLVAANPFAGIGQVTISLGVAEYRPQEDLDRFFLRVDAAMYLAKKNGRNRTECG